MNPKKDFDFEEFNEFMRHLMGVYEVIHLEQDARTYQELENMDKLEVEVAKCPCYDSVQDLISAVKEM